MVKNEQLLHFKHPNGELAMDGVVKKFTVKKGVSINMARKTLKEEVSPQKETKVVVVISDCRNPDAALDYIYNLGDVRSVARREVRRAVATRNDYYSLSFYERLLESQIDGWVDVVAVDIVKGVSYYYLTILLIDKKEENGNDAK